MNLGYDDIYTKLTGDATILSLVGTFGGGPAIFNDIIAPATNEATSYINYYQVSPLAGGDEVSSLTYSVNCRAETQPQSRAIAEAVLNACNRKTVNGAFLRCDVLPVIRPEDDSDYYNYPVEIFYRKV